MVMAVPVETMAKRPLAAKSAALKVDCVPSGATETQMSCVCEVGVEAGSVKLAVRSGSEPVRPRVIVTVWPEISASIESTYSSTPDTVRPSTLSATF